LFFRVATPWAASSLRNDLSAATWRGNLVVNLKLITPELTDVFKATRLRALQDSPTAFSSTYARESQLSDEEWLQRSQRLSRDGSIAYIAFDEDRACGLVCCYAEDDDPRRAHIISMWVDPAYRRAGVGSELINTLGIWAKGYGMRELKLMVTGVNRGAIAFYERLGFRMSGVSKPYPNDPAIMEYEMLRSLGK
jgi:ribosomal protein S18 acetylase RimI-like enzyme